MIKEIKKKQNKFGTIITYFNHEHETPASEESLNSLGAISAHVDIHHVGKSYEKTYGVNWVGYKATPPAKNLISHHISKFRGGDGIVLFLKPGIVLNQDIEPLYGYLAGNRMERAYGFWVGPYEAPVAVGVSAPLMEHLFHAIPDKTKADEDYIRWVHGWIMKTLQGGRSFDATAILMPKPVSEPQKQPEPVKSDSKAVSEHPAPPSGWDPSGKVTEKRKRGRPKKVTS